MYTDYNFSVFALKYPEISVQDTEGPKLFLKILLQLFFLEYKSLLSIYSKSTGADEDVSESLVSGWLGWADAPP